MSNQHRTVELYSILGFANVSLNFAGKIFNTVKRGPSRGDKFPQNGDTSHPARPPIHSLNKNWSIGFGASLFLHAILAFLITKIAVVKLEPDPPTPLAIEFYVLPKTGNTTPENTNDTGRYASLPERFAEAASKAPTQIPRTANKKEGSGWTEQNGFQHANTFFASEVLSAPENLKTRQVLSQTENSERELQLCNTEALEQIARWNSDLEPNLVLPYARKTLEHEGRTFHARGAAFRSKTNWYRLWFDCTLSASGIEVEAFSFRVGQLLTTQEERQYFLTTHDLH